MNYDLADSSPSFALTPFVTTSLKLQLHACECEVLYERSIRELLDTMSARKGSTREVEKDIVPGLSDSKEVYDTYT